MPAPIRGRSRPNATPPRISTALLALAALALAVVTLTGCDDGGPPGSPNAAGATAPQASLNASRAPEVIPDQYFVVFTDDVRDPPGLARQLAAQHGGDLLVA